MRSKIPRVPSKFCPFPTNPAENQTPGAFRHGEAFPHGPGAGKCNFSYISKSTSALINFIIWVGGSPGPYWGSHGENGIGWSTTGGLGVPMGWTGSGGRRQGGLVQYRLCGLQRPPLFLHGALLLE